MFEKIIESRNLFDVHLVVKKFISVNKVINNMEE